jgi:tetratricopeptide (TPR) repeat protein
MTEPDEFSNHVAHAEQHASAGRPDEAVAELKAALNLRPDADIEAALAEILVDCGKPGEAIDHFKAAIRLRPRSAEYHFRLARTYEELDQEEKALAMFQKATRLDPKDAHYALHVGISLAGLDRDEEALTAYDKVLGLNPHYQFIQINRFLSLRKLSRPEATAAASLAVAELQRGISEMPDFAPYRFHLASALDYLDRPEEVISVLGETLKSGLELDDSDRAFAHFLSGYALSNLDKEDEAIREIDEGLVIQPDNAHAFFHRGIALLALKRNEEALKDLRKCIELDATETGAQVLIANALHELGREDDARAQLALARSSHPGTAWEWMEIGRLDFLLGSPADSAASFRHAIELKPSDATAHYNLAAVLVQSNRASQAQPIIETAIGLRDNHAPSYTVLGVVLTELGQFEQARLAFHRARELAPTEARYETDLAAALLRLDRPEEAEPISLRAVERADSWYGRSVLGAIRIAMADRYHDSQLFSDAVDQIDSALKLADQAAVAAEKRAALYIERGYAYANSGQLGRARADFVIGAKLAEVGSRTQLIARRNGRRLGLYSRSWAETPRWLAYIVSAIAVAWMAWTIWDSAHGGPQAKNLPTSMGIGLTAILLAFSLPAISRIRFGGAELEKSGPANASLQLETAYVQHVEWIALEPLG